MYSDSISKITIEECTLPETCFTSLATMLRNSHFNKLHMYWVYIVQASVYPYFWNCLRSHILIIPSSPPETISGSDLMSVRITTVIKHVVILIPWNDININFMCMGGQHTSLWRICSYIPYSNCFVHWTTIKNLHRIL